jgi:hypothetical protein
MLELICPCGGSLKLIGDNPELANVWLEYHSMCLVSSLITPMHVENLLDLNGVKMYDQIMGVNVFTGETI